MMPGTSLLDCSVQAGASEGSTMRVHAGTSVPIFIGWFEAGAFWADFLRKSLGPLSERQGPVRGAVRGKRGGLGKLGPLEAPVSTRHPKAPTEDRNTGRYTVRALACSAQAR